MRLRIKATFALLLTIAAVSTAQAAAQAAQTNGNSDKPHTAELALDYSYLRSNAPPGGCSCFNLNGGSATFAWPVKPGGFALAGDVTVVHAGAISSTEDSLTLSAYTLGVRYRPRLGHWPLQPFGQVLAGLAHSNGSLVKGKSSAASNAGAAFAASRASSPGYASEPG
jgi:peptidoglycan-associated lipoprotein